MSHNSTTTSRAPSRPKLSAWRSSFGIVTTVPRAASTSRPAKDLTSFPSTTVAMHLLRQALGG